MDGAKALPLPTQYGQSMSVKKSRSSDLIWESLDKDGNTWFSSTISLYDFSAVKTTDDAVSAYLQKLLKNAVRLNSEFLSKWNGFKVETQLEFDRDWGLGSSSTLTHLVAEWAEVHPLMLHWKISNGSGYDVACSMSGAPIVFFTNDEETSYTPVDFKPNFASKLYFIHLGQKQNSNQAIKDYLKQAKGRKKLAEGISELTEAMAQVTSFHSFEQILKDHNELIQKSTGYTPAKDLHFNNYWGVVKNLGAWGGDFVLATSEADSAKTKKYFADKGFPTVLSYDEMILTD